MSLIKKFPLIRNAKTPQVNDFFNIENYPKYTEVVENLGGNYGVPCGAINGIVVIDYDVYKRTDVSINLGSLKEVHGSDSLIISTPSGGFHVYHRYSADLHEHWKGLTGLENGLIDIRTNGNYVCGAGSSIDGIPYKIVNGSFDAINEMPTVIYERLNVHMTSKSISQYIDCEEYTGLLEQKGFSNIRWVNGYDFTCDQKGRGTTCPLCENEHRNNHYFVYKDDFETVWVKNHSKKCNRIKVKSELLLTDIETEQQRVEPDTYTDEYLSLKRAFEKNVVRILNPLVYIVKSEHSVLSATMLRERFLNWRVTNEKDRKIPFVENWLRDPHLMTFKSLEFSPNGTNENIYNTWRGYEVEQLDQTGGDPEPFFNLCADLCGGDAEHFYDWLAQLFQKPEVKPITAPIFYSPQGCGKNTLMDFIGFMMGNELYYTSADVENDILGRFSTAFENRKLIVVDEADARSTFRSSSKLKALITNTTCKVERKGVQQITTKNLAGVIFTTNEDTPVKIEESDRRFFVYTSNKKYMNDSEFFRCFINDWSKKPENQRAVYDFLMGRDISKVDWIKDRPINAMYEEMRQSCLPWDVKWIENLVVYDFPVEWVDKPIKTLDLCTNYNNFTPSTFDPKNEKAFCIMLNKLITSKSLPGFEKIRTMTMRGWIINRNQVFEWLKSHRYTLEESLPDPIQLDITNDW